MAYAKCRDCGHIFHWFAGKGYRVKDLQCPKCDSNHVKGGVSLDEYLLYEEGKAI